MMARHYRRHDPLTFRYARYPHEHATPADYAKSTEGHAPDFEGNCWHWIAVAVSIVSICGVLGIMAFEAVTK